MRSNIAKMKFFKKIYESSLVITISDSSLSNFAKLSSYEVVKYLFGNKGLTASDCCAEINESQGRDEV